MSDEPKDKLAGGGGETPRNEILDGVLAPPTVGTETAAAVVSPKKGPGRHRKDCPCPVCRNRRGEAGRPSAASPVPARDTTVDTEVVKRCAASLLRAADAWTRRQIETRAEKLTDRDTAADLADAAGMGQEEADLIADLSAQIIAKYGALSKHAPEVLLAVAVTAHGARLASVFAKLAALERDRRAPAPMPAAPADTAAARV